METAGWTAAVDAACPAVGRLKVGARLEESHLENFRFRSLALTLGLPVEIGGADSNLFVRPLVHAGTSYQSVSDLDPLEGAHRERLADESVFTAGAGLDLGYDLPGPVSLLVGTGWQTNFNDSETRCVPLGPNLPACVHVDGYGDLNRFTVSGGLLLDLFSP